MREQITIDEYLNKLRTLKNRADGLCNIVQELEDKATSSTVPWNIGMPRGSGNSNNSYIDEVYTDLGDAIRDCREALEDYSGYRELLHRNVLNLLYWEGLLIENVYIYNVAFERDPLEGTDQILKTRDQNEIREKLNGAKQHLAELLRSQGMNIVN